MKPIRSTQQALFLAAFLTSALLLSACNTGSEKSEEELIEAAQAIHEQMEVPEGYALVLVHGINYFPKGWPADPFVLLLPHRMLDWTDSIEEVNVFDLNTKFDPDAILSREGNIFLMGNMFIDIDTNDAYNVTFARIDYLDSNVMDEEEKGYIIEDFKHEIVKEDYSSAEPRIENIEFAGFKGRYVHRLRTPLPDSMSSYAHEAWSIEDFGAILQNQTHIFKLSYSGPPEVRSEEQVEETLQEALTILRSIRFIH